MKFAARQVATAAFNKTWEEVYCTRHGCTPMQFRRRVFWRTLHRHALVLAPLFFLGHHFTADFELINACGHSRSMGSLEDEIKEYHRDSRNTRWLRRRARIRISTHKLRRLARGYL